MVLFARTGKRNMADQTGTGAGQKNQKAAESRYFY